MKWISKRRRIDMSTMLPSVRRRRKYMEQMILYLVLSMIGWYLVSYIKERGKNLATKKDIEEITHKVESVKSDIHLISEQQQQYHRQRNDALLAFFDCATILILDKLTRNYADFKLDDGKELSKHLEAVYDRFIGWSEIITVSLVCEERSYHTFKLLVM